MLQVVPEQRLSLQQLAGHNGSDPDKAILLAVRGTVFDVTKGAPGPLPDFQIPSPERTLPAPSRPARPAPPLSPHSGQ